MFAVSLSVSGILTLIDIGSLAARPFRFLNGESKHVKDDTAKALTLDHTNHRRTRSRSPVRPLAGKNTRRDKDVAANTSSTHNNCGHSIFPANAEVFASPVVVRVSDRDADAQCERFLMFVGGRDDTFRCFELSVEDPKDGE